MAKYENQLFSLLENRSSTQISGIVTSRIRPINTLKPGQAMHLIFQYSFLADLNFTLVSKQDGSRTEIGKTSSPSSKLEQCER